MLFTLVWYGGGLGAAPPSFFERLVGLLGFVLRMAYVLGAVPALGTGVVHAVIQRRSAPWIRVVAVGVAGVLISALFAWAAITGADAFTVSVRRYIIVIGGISALLMALGVEGMACRRLNRHGAGPSLPADPV
jgi:hypothetical protein